MNKRQMLQHELVMRRHTKEMREAHLRIADQCERLARIKHAGHQHRAPGMQHRIGIAVQAAGMKERKHAQKDTACPNLGRSARFSTLSGRIAMI